LLKSAEAVKLEADATGVMEEMRDYAVQLIDQKEMDEK